jgi:hypothetical protein
MTSTWAERYITNRRYWTQGGIWKPYKVSVPPGRSGAMEIDRFTITPEIHRELMLDRQVTGGRAIPMGGYTRLAEGPQVWMSDTPAEIGDHWPAIERINDGAVSVLITGLGIGMVVQAALRAPSVRSVDVIERDIRVIALSGPHYEAMAEAEGKTLNIVHGDAFDRPFAKSVCWDIVWHDIWPMIAPENLPEMTKLKRLYGRGSGYSGCWCETECKRMKEGRWPL